LKAEIDKMQCHKNGNQSHQKPSKFLSKSDFKKMAQKWSFLNVARATFLCLWSKYGPFCAF